MRTYRRPEPAELVRPPPESAGLVRPRSEPAADSAIRVQTNANSSEVTEALISRLTEAQKAQRHAIRLIADHGFEITKSEDQQMLKAACLCCQYGDWAISSTNPEVIAASQGISVSAANRDGSDERRLIRQISVGCGMQTVKHEVERDWQLGGLCEGSLSLTPSVSHMLRFPFRNESRMESLHVWKW